MASAQVLPSSRKQEHLEAGKRRLEEFRKKKAAERVKKTAATNQPNPSDVSQDHGKNLETEHVQIPDLDGAGTSHGPGGSVGTFVVATSSKNRNSDLREEVEQRSSEYSDANSLSMTGNSKSFKNEMQQRATNYDSDRLNASGLFEGRGSDFGAHTGSQSELPNRFLSDHSVVLQTQTTQNFNSSSSISSFYAKELLHSHQPSISMMDSETKSLVSQISNSSANSTSSWPPIKPSYASTLDNGVEYIQPKHSMSGSRLEFETDVKGSHQLSEPVTSNVEKKNFSSPNSGDGGTVQISKPVGLNSDIQATSNDSSSAYLLTAEIPARRSRPSFLDSLNVAKTSGSTPSQHTQRGALLTSIEKFNGVDELGLSTFQKSLAENETVGPFSKLQSAPSVFDHPMSFAAVSSNVSDIVNSNFGGNQIRQNHEFYAPKQDENFTALEQHIEDLTQEKFSLQRALESSRALAESLAAENSSLTDSYNHQRGVVNQLKSEMEKLQVEIQEHLVELEAVKIQYANAQLECNAADERSKLLASEVIGLEEKARWLRSSELKLERQLGDLQSEIISYKKRLSSLEKERQDLQLTIDALQEEKKLLQSKMRKASANGKSVDVIKSSTNKKDMSTSTEDLGDATAGSSNQGMKDAVAGTDHPIFSMAIDDILSNFEDSSVYIPPDQMRMIQNISALISELALEKEELMQTLSSESSECSKLKDLNKELSRKLEVQTQRLELLTAQNMANDNIQMSLPDSHTVHENTTYADEGDEVVERVLGWIMKLFPGGPSRRRTSKLL